MYFPIDVDKSESCLVCCSSESFLITAVFTGGEGVTKGTVTVTLTLKGLWA